MELTKTQKRRLRKERLQLQYQDDLIHKPVKPMLPVAIVNTPEIDTRHDILSNLNSDDEEVLIPENDSKLLIETSKPKDFKFTRKVYWTLSDITPKLLKYWHQRYSLFPNYDSDIKMDLTGWYSATPYKIAVHHAERFKNCDVIIDAFCGVGGNSIEFAKICTKVICVDLDRERLEMTKWNAFISGVYTKMEFHNDDFLEIAPTLKADGVFLSPPWGGPEYLNTEFFDIETMVPNCTMLFEVSRTISENVCLFLPRNIIHEQVIRLAGDDGDCELEQCFLDDRLKSWNAYYGGLVKM